MLTDGEVTGMRTEAERSLPGTAIVETSTRASDGGGGGTMVWTASGTVDCRVAPAGGAEQVGGDRLQPETEVIVTLPQATVIDPDARLRYGDKVYAVTALRAPRTWELTRRVEAKEIR